MAREIPILTCPEGRDCSTLAQFNDRLAAVADQSLVETVSYHPAFRAESNTTNVESYGNTFLGNGLARSLARRMKRELAAPNGNSCEDGHCVAAGLLIENFIGDAGHFSRVEIRARTPVQP